MHEIAWFCKFNGPLTGTLKDYGEYHNYYDIELSHNWILLYGMFVNYFLHIAVPEPNAALICHFFLDIFTASIVACEL